MIDIQILHADITTLEADCIVAPVGLDWMPAYEVGEAICSAAGSEELEKTYQRVRSSGKRTMRIKTPGFQLKAKSILHAVTPESWTQRKIKDWYCAGLAMNRKEHSVAFPFLETGMEVRAVWQIVLKGILEWGETSPSFENGIHVLFAVRDEADCQMGLQVLQECVQELERKRAEQALKDSIDRKKLREYIELLCRIRRIEWEPMRKIEEGRCQLGYPEYPPEIFEVFQVMEPDYQYDTNMRKILDRRLLPTELSLAQIQTCLTWICRGERFCDGMIAEKVNDGTLLKLFCRLEDLLLKQYRW